MLILLINHILSNFLLGLGLITEKSKFPPQKFVNNENSLEAPINIVINLVEKVSAILDDTKSENISVVDLKNKTSIADFFVIATCRSSRHADSTADEITRQLKSIGIKCPSPSGRPQCDWVIVDAGPVIVHLFRSEIRELYSLEKLWGMSFDSVENKTA